MNETYIKTRAQYIADSVDARIFLRFTEDLEPTEERLDRFLRDVGWNGRKYPVDFFRCDSIPIEPTE